MRLYLKKVAASWKSLEPLVLVGIILNQVGLWIGSLFTRFTLFQDNIFFPTVHRSLYEL
jgi:hypothetical protein